MRDRFHKALAGEATGPEGSNMSGPNSVGSQFRVSVFSISSD